MCLIKIGDLTPKSEKKPKKLTLAQKVEMAKLAGKIIHDYIGEHPYLRDAIKQRSIFDR